MKITKRTQSNSGGSYSNAIGSNNFAGFFAPKKNPKRTQKSPDHRGPSFILSKKRLFLYRSFTVTHDARVITILPCPITCVVNLTATNGTPLSQNLRGP
jgi:hypothetical protein